MFNPEYADDIITTPYLTVQTAHGEIELSWTNLDKLVADLEGAHWNELPWFGNIFDDEGPVGVYFVSEETETVAIHFDRMTCWDRANVAD